MKSVFLCVTNEHDLRLIGLSAFVCLLSAIVSVDLLQRARLENRNRSRLAWLGGAALTIGAGIWATHFIALLGYQPGGVPLEFSLGITFVSALAGLAFFGIAFLSLAAKPRHGGTLSSAAAGVVFGGGIAVLHYVGISAAIVPGAVEWDAGLVAFSVGTGCALGAASAVTFELYGRSAAGRTAAASLLALAVCAHHFIGMGAITMIADPSRPVFAATLPRPWLVGAIVAAMAAILALGAASGTFHRALTSNARRERRRLSALANAAFEGLVICRGGLVAEVNESYCNLVGTARDRLVGQPFEKQMSDADSPLFARHIEDALFAAHSNEGIASDIRISNCLRLDLLDAKKLSIPVEIFVRPMEPTNRGEPQMVIAVRDIRDRQEADKRVRYLARHDELTGLINRSFFVRCLDDEFSRARAAPGADSGAQCFALHYIDLDGFSEINDAAGHTVGDQILENSARILEKLCGPGDIVARLGSDEFALVQSNFASFLTDSERGPEKKAKDICSALSRSLLLADGLSSAAVSASVGFSIFPRDGATPDALIRSAGMALQQAKAAGRGATRAFASDMAEKALKRRCLLNDLRDAVNSKNGLSVVFQPQVRTADRVLVGFEALVRWTHPHQGPISPALFVPLAEEGGFIGQLGDWVLRTAAKEAAAWHESLSVAVNLSPIEVIEGDLPSRVQEALLDTGLSPTRLELEITEGVLIQDFDRALQILRRLKAMGIRFAMDDFGTGYSSLSYLQSFPFDKIKIDRSFIMNLDQNGQSRAIVRAVVSLGAGLGIPVLAEGVETEAQLEILASENCDAIQGYLIGRPDKIERFGELMRGVAASASLLDRAHVA